MAFPIGDIQRSNQLSQNGSFITITNLLAKIGGQVHYKSSLQVAIPSLTANVLYLVYAVLTAPNTPALVISTNLNSVGPAGYTSWDLVGAFYANAATTAGFGSFVNITGAPETQNEISENGVSQLSAFWAGFSAFTVTRYAWSRIGRHLFVNWRLDSVTGNGISGRVPIPRGGIITEDVGSGVIGTYAGQNGSANASGGSMIGLGSTDVGFAGPNLTGAAISLQIGTAIVGTAPTTLTGQFQTRVPQWSNIPLKDL